MATGRMARVIDDLLTAAERAAADHEWAAVLDRCEDVLALEPDNYDAAALRTLAERHVGRAASDAGRRQVTVLFADLVGSTAMGEALDPEPYLEVVRAYETACRSVIDHYGGHINRFAGDGLIAYFGFPSAHEDDAVRAALAAVRALDELRRVAEDVADEYGVVLAARIGVHTGPVVLVDRGSAAWTARDDAFGPTVNMAARLQGVARPGTVVVSDATAALLNASVVLEPLGPHQLAGVGRLVDVFAVTAGADDAPRAPVAGPAAGGLVGRRDEREDLLARLWALDDAPSGPGRVVVLRGEAGVGKSRLLAELTAANADGFNMVFQCSPLPITRSLHPVRGAITRHAGIDAEDRPGGRLRKLEAMVEAAGMAPADVVPYLAMALSVDVQGRYDPVELDAALVREALLEQLVALAANLAARRGPLVVVVEDVQWADAMTVDLLGRLLAAGPPPRVLVAMTSRPSSTWPLGPTVVAGVDVLEVGRLTDAEVRELARANAGGDVDDRVIDEVTRRSDGIPLYVPALVSAVDADRAGGVVAGAEGSGPLRPGPTAVPGPLVELLQSRLDTLGGAKAVAQVAATIGYSIDVRVLRDVVGVLAGAGDEADLDPGRVDAHLERLIASHLLDPDDDHHLRFHHVLLADAAYDSQLLRTRPHRHRAVAEVLATWADRGEPADLALVAYHYDKGRDPARAVAAYVGAAELAARLGAPDEALAHLGRADELSADMAGPDAVAAELAVRLARGTITSALGGWAAPGVLDDYARALELASHATDDAAAGATAVRALIGTWSWYCATGDLDRAALACDAIADQLGRTPVPAGAPTLASCRGAELFYRGRFLEAQQLLLAAVEGFEDDDIDDWAQWQNPNDPMASAYAFLATIACLSGDLDASLAALDAGVARSRVVPFPHGPFSEAYVLSYAAWVHRAQGDTEAATAACEGIARIGAAHGFLYWAVASEMVAKANEVAAAPTAEAVAGLGAGIAGYRAFGGEAMVPSLLLEQAAGHLALGDVAEAGACVDDALTFTDQCYARAEGLRLRAEVAAARGGFDPAAVAADLDLAAALAAEQHAPRYLGMITASRLRILGDSTARLRPSRAAALGGG